ncbi:MAG: hypothetical protein O3B41_03700 [Bacteroidetes bacterium]|nr:hypothetical protein [Bacteroidota bacterium]
MRTSLFALFFALLLAANSPVQAQLRSAGSPAKASVPLYDQGGSGFSLNKYFSPEHFAMSHSFELSSMGGNSLSMYTNTMQWQFSSKLAARMDVAAAYSPLSGQSGMSVTGQNDSQVFIKNAQIAYRPKENMEIHLSFRQNPYGSMLNPYGYGGYGGYGNGYSRYGGSSLQADYNSTGRELFWNDRLR